MRTSKLQNGTRYGGLRFYLSIVIVTLIFILYQSERVYIYALGEKVQEIRKRNSELMMQINNLKIEVAELRSGTRIKKIAQDYLNMRMPEGAPERLF